MPLLGVSELVAWRRRTEPPVFAGGRAELPTAHGPFHAIGYAGDGVEHIALVRGVVTGAADVPVHLHVECLAGDVLGSTRCSCAAQRDAALAAIDRAGRGVLVYLRCRQRPGSGLVHALHGCATWTDREEMLAAHILDDLGVRRPPRTCDDRQSV
ncbi:hypothetical protein [Pseudonocardia sp. GCM10023141]|uniref:hypothetical protein n=1 Tax=Pseudonocardia sp. GCM10023141 TaxID=3252653 RepID=UPI003611311F